MDITSYILGKKAGGGSAPTGTIEITENGTTNVSNYAYADVDVQPDLETKSITITENTTTTITPTSGKDGLSSVEITTDVQSGGIIIDGVLENKTIDSGSVSKGDFVTNNIITLNTYSNNNTYYWYSTSKGSVSNLENIYDENDDTYCTTTSNNNNVITLYVKCKSASELNIPQSAKITSFQIAYKAKFLNAGSDTKGRAFCIYFTNFTSGSGWTLTPTTEAIIDSNIHEGVLPMYDFVQITSNDLENMGCYFGYTSYIPNTRLNIYVYYVKFIIEYEDNGTIHTVASDVDTIVGIANEDGVSGDTIQVYVPDVS